MNSSSTPLSLLFVASASVLHGCHLDWDRSVRHDAGYNLPDASDLGPKGGEGPSRDGSAGIDTLDASVEVIMTPPEGEPFAEPDSGCQEVEGTWYEDLDGDGHGDPARSVVACSSWVEAGKRAWVALGDDCNPGLSTTFPGADDEPDDDFVDSNCDGVDGNAAALVFVDGDPSGNGSDLTGTGTRAAPYRSIGKAIAEAGPSKQGVAVAQGRYQEHINVVNGVSIFGGYSRSGSPGKWTRSLLGEVIVEQPSSDTASGYIEAVFAENISIRTVLDRLTVRAGDKTIAPTASGTSVYGIRVQNSQADAPNGRTLELRNLKVVAGKASAGSDGSAGHNGSKGNSGSSGKNRNENGQGGPPMDCGDNTFSRAGGAGGEGGYDGVGGSCSGPVAGQAGGYPEGIFNDSIAACRGGGGSYGRCDSQTRGQDGGVGARDCNPPVSHGAHALAVSGTGQVGSEGLWVSFNGNSGKSWGSHGGGGAGGGGGGGGDCGAFCQGFEGGKGGGGGSGGCGGGPGAGGMGGGSSFALFVTNSTGLLIFRSSFEAGDAGAGGRGGAAGAGGLGGQGGSGAAGNQSSADKPQNSGNGGRGGDGQQGGYGGAGGGGAGGHSIAQLLCNSSVDGSSDAGLVGSRGQRGGAATPGAPEGNDGRAEALVILSGACSL